MFTALEFSLTVLISTPTKGVIVIACGNDGSINPLLRDADTLGQFVIGIVSQLQGAAEADDSIA